MSVVCIPLDRTDRSDAANPPEPLPSESPSPILDTKSRKLAPPRSSSRKRSRLSDDSFVPSPRMNLNNITPEEEALRCAEAEILFPKYAAKYNARKRGKNGAQGGSRGYDPRYLPDSEYRGQQTPIILCASDLKDTQRAKIQQYFKNDCQFPGERKSKKIPSERAVFDEKKWEEAQLNRCRPEFIEPPPPGSLDDTPIFGHKKTKDPGDQKIMDSFIMALKQAMGDDYIDINDLRYFPRSDGRVYTFQKAGSKTERRMKNGHLDVTVFLRNREIQRKLETVKNDCLLKGIHWTEELEEACEMAIIRYVDPNTVCKGRTYFSIQDELGVHDDHYSPPEPLAIEKVTTPCGLDEDGLAKTFFWSEKRQRMVSFEEVRQQAEN